MNLNYILLYIKKRKRIPSRVHLGHSQTRGQVNKSASRRAGAVQEMKKMGNIFSWRSSSSSRTPTTSMAASRSGSAGFGSDSCSRISSAPSTTSFVAAAAAGGSSGSRGYRRSKKNHKYEFIPDNFSSLDQVISLLLLTSNF